jgi:hypothetical protein
VSGARYEQPDGSPIRVDRDFFGQPRNEQNPMPGPFELPPGKVLLKIWPKTFEDTKPFRWKALLSGGKMRQGKDANTDSAAPKKGKNAKGKQSEKIELK